jgi:hypothetical protein
MPRGVPAAGFRMTKNRVDPNINLPIVSSKVETEEEIETRINERFFVLDEFTNFAVQGEVRSLIISGPAGLGKSYTVEKVLKNWDSSGDNHTVVKGYVKATGLYRLLYQHRFRGQILVFDDADTIFFDDTSLNMLKAVCDTNDTRRVSYMSEYVMIDGDSSEILPKSFEFNGTIIFITNLDFDAMIEKNHKLTPHLQAMVSRSHYIDCGMKSKRDYIVRIKQVMKDGLLTDKGLSYNEQFDVMKFIEDNQDNLRELSLRMALKIGSVRKMNNNGKWQSIARITCCKN